MYKQKYSDYTYVRIDNRLGTTADPVTRETRPDVKDLIDVMEKHGIKMLEITEVAALGGVHKIVIFKEV